MKSSEMDYLGKILELEFMYWAAELGPDDERWLEVMKRKPELFDGFSGEATPRNIRQYLCERHVRLNGKAIREESARMSTELERLDDIMFFRTLLEKRLGEYRDAPYTGPLGIGHFVGIKDAGKERVIGYIRDYYVKDGAVSQFVLQKEDAAMVTVPVEQTYRIY